MKFDSRLHALPALLATLAVLPALASCPARADLKVTQTIQMSGEGAPASEPPSTVTTYYKGTRSRSESGNRITLQGIEPGKVYILDSAAKTYYASAPGEAARQMMASAGPMGSMASMVRPHVKTDILPATEKKTILGKATEEYRYSMTISMTLEGMDPAMSAILPKVVVTGDKWIAAGIPVPKALESATSSMMQYLPPMLTGGLKDMNVQTGATKGFPLVDVSTMEIVFPKDSPLIGMAGGQIPKKMTVRTETKSISEDPLPDDLFALPADYKLIDAPAISAPVLPGGTGQTPVPPATAP